MKGVESFLYLLVIAIVIIVILLVFSAFVTVTPPLEEGEFTVLEEFSLGIVGASAESVSTTIRLGDFRVGETQEELLKEVIQMDISQGISGGVSKQLLIGVAPSFLEQNKGVKISFSVLEANPLGNLKISWNGKVFFNAKPSGLTEFEIPPDFVKEENIVTVAAEGPGLQFWSATQYQVRNFRVFVLVGPQKIVPFELLPSELQTFDRGEVSFFGSGPGLLEVKVNGVSIFSSQPAGPEIVEFTLGTVPLHGGNNILAFISTDSNTLSGASLRIFSLESQLVKTRSFTLTEGQLASFAQKQGRISFIIDEFIRSGILEIKLNGKRLDLQVIQKGENIISYSIQDLQEGDNTLEFSGTGAWEIPSVKLGIA